MSGQALVARANLAASRDGRLPVLTMTV